MFKKKNLILILSFFMLMLFTACEKGIIKENPQGETLEDNGQQEVVEQEKIEKEEEMSEEGKDLVFVNWKMVHVPIQNWSTIL